MLVSNCWGLSYLTFKILPELKRKQIEKKSLSWAQIMQLLRWAQSPKRHTKIMVLPMMDCGPRNELGNWMVNLSCLFCLHLVFILGLLGLPAEPQSTIAPHIGPTPFNQEMKQNLTNKVFFCCSGTGTYVTILIIRSSENTISDIMKWPKYTIYEFIR